jgi:hypothetical protein
MRLRKPKGLLILTQSHLKFADTFKNRATMRFSDIHEALTVNQKLIAKEDNSMVDWACRIRCWRSAIGPVQSIPPAL